MNKRDSKLYAKYRVEIYIQNIFKCICNIFKAHLLEKKKPVHKHEMRIDVERGFSDFSPKTAALTFLGGAWGWWQKEKRNKTVC